MANASAHTEIRDQHIADLRAALTRAVPHLAFHARQVAADDPEYAERLMAATDTMQDVLNRTAP